MQPVRSQFEQTVLRAAWQGGLVPGPAPLFIPKLLAELQVGLRKQALGPGPAQPSSGSELSLWWEKLYDTIIFQCLRCPPGGSKGGAE